VTTRCAAHFHNTIWAYRRHHCRCPAAVAIERAYGRLRASRRPRAQRPNSGGRPKASEIDYDWVKVERAIAGDRSFRLTVPELADAIARLDRFGRTAEQIAVRLGVAERTVQRHRTARREAAEKETAAVSSRRTPMSTPAERSTSQGNRTAHLRQDQAA
jgi:hypothetical protein